MNANSFHIAPQSGIAVELRRGQRLRIIDPQGEQVSDLAAFDAHDIAHTFSPGRTIDYAEAIYLTKGNVLYSNRSRPLLTIVEDTVGRHDLLLSPCSEEMFRILYGQEDHPSCLSNLSAALHPFGISEDGILSAFNVFMNVSVLADGRTEIGPPLSEPGDYLDLRAEADLIIGLTACSSENTNNGTVKPIDVTIGD
ncbi:MAG TPA: urea carboxylase-associated family protein [Dehalococcoidia bacterium]|nr:urea carboxylase-associated family protein [Dehalococcoidia bacterium]